MTDKVADGVNNNQLVAKDVSADELLDVRYQFSSRVRVLNLTGYTKLGLLFCFSRLGFHCLNGFSHNSRAKDCVGGGKVSYATFCHVVPANLLVFVQRRIRRHLWELVSQRIPLLLGSLYFFLGFWSRLAFCFGFTRSGRLFGFGVSFAHFFATSGWFAYISLICAFDLNGIFFPLVYYFNFIVRFSFTQLGGFFFFVPSSSLTRFGASFLLSFVQRPRSSQLLGYIGFIFWGRGCVQLLLQHFSFG